MLESDWLTDVLRRVIISREAHGERSSRQISWPHYSSVSLRQMISVISKVLQHNFFIMYRPYIIKCNFVAKHGQDLTMLSVFLLYLFVLPTSSLSLTYCLSVSNRKHIAYRRYSLSQLSVSPSQTHIVCTHLNISANVVSTNVNVSRRFYQ